MAIIDGRALATKFNDKSAEIVGILKRKGIHPSLAVILVGDNPASEIYVNNKVKKCNELGIKSYKYHLENTISQEELKKLIVKLNLDHEVNGILVQLPLPSHIAPYSIIDIIDPKKDVDGFTKENIGLLALNKAKLIPCTPVGCLKILESLNLDLVGKKAVILGRSNIVGRPLASLLLNHDLSVSILHSKSKNIEEEIKSADILISACGMPNMVKAEWIKPGSIVIDVGITKIDNKIIGDVAFQNAVNKAAYITPVPGGVGPMTIAMLIRNTLIATCLQHEIWLDELDV